MTAWRRGRRQAALVERAEEPVPGRRQQPGPRVPLRRPSAARPRARRRAVRLGCRRAALRRLHRRRGDPAILGHGIPRSSTRSRSRPRNGLALGATHPLEIELGEAIRAAMPSIERLRFTSSGTEAVMSALRRRPRRDGSRPRRQVRRRLPRPLRRAPRRGRLGRRDPRDPGQRRRPGGRRGVDDRAAVQRPRRGDARVRRARRADRGGHRRARRSRTPA
jgi:hypothetical protein